jgi:hypothetical protein
MRNKIKQYSWIHELKQSAIESKLLAEAKLFKNFVNLNEQAGPTRDELRRYAEILAQKKASDPRLQNTSKDLQVTDVDSDGDRDAEDVKKDAFDNIIGNERPFSGLPSFNFARQEGIPEPIQHPDAPYTGGLTPNEMTARANLELRRDMQADLERERAYEEDEDARRNAFPSAAWRTMKENANLTEKKLLVDKEINRIIKSAPAGKIYSINELRLIAKKLLGS